MRLKQLAEFALKHPELEHINCLIVAFRRKFLPRRRFIRVMYYSYVSSNKTVLTDVIQELFDDVKCDHLPEVSYCSKYKRTKSVDDWCKTVYNHWNTWLRNREQLMALVEKE